MERRTFLKGILGASAVAIAPKALTEADKGLLIESGKTTNYARSIDLKSASWEGLDDGKLYDENFKEITGNTTFADWTSQVPYEVGDVVINTKGDKRVIAGKVIGNI